MSSAPASSEFSLYQRFNRRVDLEETAAILRANNIPVRLSDEGEGLGDWTEKTIVGTPLRPKFWIEIPADQFEKANFMLQEAAEADLDDEEIAAHPFNDYSIEELQEVLVEESAWSPEAVVVARRLLLRRGGDVDLKRLRDAARARLAVEYTPQSAARWWLVSITATGVGAALVVSFIGIMIAVGLLAYYAFGTRRDPKGTRHAAYGQPSRRFGRAALGLIVAAAVIGLANRFFLHWVVVPNIDEWLWWWR